MLNADPALGGFAELIVQWQKHAGRHDLPWQGTRDPYKIWLSEIMLQQTQAGTVAAYYKRFLQRFPTLNTLALASQDEVMPYWAGLGYYARARNLHRCAQDVYRAHNGIFPSTAAEIMNLPGIGRSTAAAIAAFAHGQRVPIMDGNVKRVFSRYFGIYGNPAVRAVENVFWRAAENVLDAAPADLDMAAYTQGLMDLGATCCSRGRPACGQCPLNIRCYARIESRQHELPTPKPKKIGNQRYCKMLILENSGNILLERRPAPGIWGGLWSPPQYDDLNMLKTASLNWGQSAAASLQMATVLHKFSHFALQIEPWHIVCTAPVMAEPAAGQAWVCIDALRHTALPAPVKKILSTLFG